MSYALSPFAPISCDLSPFIAMSYTHVSHPHALSPFAPMLFTLAPISHPLSPLHPMSCTLSPHVLHPFTHVPFYPFYTCFAPFHPLCPCLVSFHPLLHVSVSSPQFFSPTKFLFYTFQGFYVKSSR